MKNTKKEWIVDVLIITFLGILILSFYVGGIKRPEAKAENIVPEMFKRQGDTLDDKTRK